jgi:hypothetical protein
MMTVSAGVLKSAHQADCQHGGSQMPDIQLTVSAGFLKSRHPADYQRGGSTIQTSSGLSVQGFSNPDIPLTVSAWVLKAGQSMDNLSLISPQDITWVA